ncbi:UPF0280 [Desulfonema limicola]|uniref:UPF0280 n=1 Tax=Desulfonema limicola TaxID=45656 RepID=A0A975GHI9_9BACT|nr:UPF0280 family protein [Desulfonema limicola]QTA81521.1 UPF0280 [Desulfonema limicola]
MYEERSYRKLIDKGRREFFKITVKETDLYIHARPCLKETVKELILQYRGYIEAYICQYPEFAAALNPWHLPGPAHKIIRDMADAGIKAGVGPMAAVAGVMSEYVGQELLKYSREVIVENGGDIFIKTSTPVTTAIYAGTSRLSMKIGLKIDSTQKPVSICTSSGTIGHSLSFGKADAICVISDICAIADAAATSIGNHVKTKSDIQKSIEFGKKIQGVRGIVIIMGDNIGAWGDVELVPV